MTTTSAFRRPAFHGAMQRLRRLRLVRFLTKPAIPVLPVYKAERSGVTIAARRTVLLVSVMFLAAVYGLLAAVLPLQMLAIPAVPLVLMALVVIWALPEARQAPTRLLAKLYLAYMVAALVWPNYLALSVGGLPWISIRRMIGSIALLTLMISLSVSKKFRSEMAAIMRAAPIPSRLLLAFIMVQIVASIATPAASQTIPRLIGIVLTVTPMAFISLWLIGTDTRTPEWWVTRLFWCVGVLMAIGVLEFRVKHVLWAYSIPSFLRVDEQFLTVVLTPGFRGTYRVLTTFSSPLVWGELTALTIPFVLHRIANSRGVGRLAFWIFFDFLVVASGFLSGSRLAMVGGLVAHTVYLLIWAIRRWRTTKGGLVGISLTLTYPALMVALSLAVMFVPAVHNRVLGGGASQLSNQGRQEQFRLGVPAIARRPFFGYGPGEGAGAVGWRNQQGFLSIDSGFLSVAADYGLLGFVSLYGTMITLMILLAFRGLKMSGDGYPLELAVATFLAVLLNTRSVLSQGDNDPFIFMTLGLGIALLYRSRPVSLSV
uniref:Putative diutan polysaccharide polymerase n=1 Tax=Sphingomonas sp. ATCC 53159 TaxID=194870 RepID=B4XES8_9SPHN|nr:putative diutan polysaccharide polymerase [Sphingomonas sp. ATCC 53159]